MKIWKILRIVVKFLVFILGEFSTEPIRKAADKVVKSEK